MNLTFALIKLERFDEAQAQNEAILRVDPNNAQAHNLYGLILMGKNQPGTAMSQFEMAIKLKPDFDDAKKNLEAAKAKK